MLGHCGEGLVGRWGRRFARDEGLGPDAEGHGRFGRHRGDAVERSHPVD